MNKQPIISIEFDNEGNAVIDVTNVTGPTCKSLTKNLESILGVTQSVTNKSEYNQLQNNVTQQKAQS